MFCQDQAGSLRSGFDPPDWAGFAGGAIIIRYQRCEMRSPTFVAELHKKLGAPSSETLESLRLLKAFVKLAPSERFEVIALVERLAMDACSDLPIS